MIMEAAHTFPGLLCCLRTNLFIVFMANSKWATSLPTGQATQAPRGALLKTRRAVLRTAGQEACGLQLKFSEGFSRQGGFQQVWDNPHAPHAATYIYVPVEGTAKHTSGECNVFSGGWPVGTCWDVDRQPWHKLLEL